MKTIISISCFLIVSLAVFPQHKDTIFSFAMGTDVTVTVDQPALHDNRKTIIVLYALPNGNTTAQTMGKKMNAGDDWHFDIQHIRAQARFIRQTLRNTNVIVAYLENNFKSWPQWKATHADYITVVQHIVDTVYNLFAAKEKVMYMNGHSGGGRFIFSYLDGVQQIPSWIKRISFLDSNYGYDSTYLPKFRDWLNANKDTYLNLFAYNDSVALYNDKPVVSATGGTWYRGHLLLQDLQAYYTITKKRNDSIIVFKSADSRIQFFFKTNPDRKIYHTQQVELNGFIHSVLCGTRYDSKKYRYYGPRAYTSFIE